MNGIVQKRQGERFARRVVDYMRARGLRHAHRAAEEGSNDKADVSGTVEADGMLWEIKSRANGRPIRLSEAMNQVREAAGRVDELDRAFPLRGVVVTQRPGHHIEESAATLELGQLVDLVLELRDLREFARRHARCRSKGVA